LTQRVFRFRQCREFVAVLQEGSATNPRNAANGINLVKLEFRPSVGSRADTCSTWTSKEADASDDRTLAAQY
jgi:hypothetical protein